MKASAESRRVGTLIKAIREESLHPRPDFQRRTVWTNPDKVAFIDTILSDYPFPEIYIATKSVDTETGEVIEMLVDGQQRLQTIYDYFRGVSPFKNARSIRPFKDLLKEEKETFLAYEVAVRNLGQLQEETIRGVFGRMNRTSYSLNDMERYNAAYLGLFKKFSETMAENSFFKDVKLFSSTDIRRMKDVSYIASLSATMMSTYFNRDDEVESYLEQYNDAFPELPEIHARLNAALDFIKELGLPEKSRAWRKVDFYNLLVEVDRQLFAFQRKPDPVATRTALAKLYTQVDEARNLDPTDENVKRYFSATLQNTNDRAPRISRGEVLQNILNELPSTPFELIIPAEAPDLTDISLIGEEADAAEAATGGSSDSP